MQYWKRIKAKFATQDGIDKSESTTNESFLVNKKIEKKFIKDIKYKNLNNSPVFLSFLIVVLVTNLLIFFAILAKDKIGNLKDLDSRWYVLFFGANHTSSVLEGKQAWRVISYAFIERVSGLQILISAIFIWITFYSLGFYQEVFLGSKKTLVIWGIGVPLIGLTQLFLTKNEAVYYYGTEYLTWLSLGSLTCLLTGKMIRNEQAVSLVKGSLIRVAVFLIIFAIIKYVDIRGGMSFDNQSVLRVGSYYITFVFLSFLIGYFLTLLLNYKNVQSNAAIYGAIIFFAVLVIALFAMGILGITSYNIGDNSWKKIKPFY